MNLPSKAMFMGLLLLNSPHPIVMRHDVDEAKYLELAQTYGGSTVRLNVGCGTLIRPRWILTAAHVASSPRLGNDVAIHGVKYGIRSRVIHPGFAMDRRVLNDIALIELDKAVPEAQLAKLYRRSDEVGKEIVFVGTGWAGTGDKGMVEGSINKDRRLRAAQNRVDGTKPGYIQFAFDAPGSEGALPLEGISGPGDSGGAALWFAGSQAYILGVSSHQDRRGAAVEGVYGAYEYYARVSEFHEWILAEIGEQ